MATVDIKLVAVQARALTGATLAIPDPTWVAADVITSSGSSQQSDFAVPAGATGLAWMLTVKGGAVRAMFGADPTAADSEDGGWLILDGQTRAFAGVGGHMVAVIDSAA
jgi:hypothetical protein